MQEFRRLLPHVTLADSYFDTRGYAPRYREQMQRVIETLRRLGLPD